MMGNWKTCQLGDLITFQRGHDLPKSKMKGGIYPVVGSNGIIGYHDEYTVVRQIKRCTIHQIISGSVAIQ